MVEGALFSAEVCRDIDSYPVWRERPQRSFLSAAMSEATEHKILI